MINKMAALGLGAISFISAQATAQLKVVATTPDLASVAREIGGDKVNVVALAKPTEDAHFVDAKPSFIVTLNRTDALIEGGAELELGWLPPLLENSRNSRIAAGAPGRIVASEGIRLLEIPTSFDRSKGDIHALGNPHYMVDPAAAKVVARNIASHFAQLDPKNAATYNANLARFNSKLDAKLAAWQKELAPYRGAKIVTYHRDFIYFADRFGLSIVDELEPKPGIAPSPAHLAQVIGEMKRNNVKVILVQPFQNRKTAETVARQTGATVVDAPQQPGAASNSATYFDNMDNLVRAIASALGGAK
ncbi:MAG TPA: metal ABC transporter substrate-binding protein [Gemmatimonadaceae bacterium]|jgi:zinc/manganese transport system substrate-binding protein|nr:metal ABC transporter substrate-binding protein [Gemmatimonadaceae bacterium]